MAPRTTTLRPWQDAALKQLEGWEGTPFLISAAPGAGKTIPSLVLARRLLEARAIQRVAVVCPTTPLTRQWAEAAGRLGVQLVPDAEELRPPSGFHGVSVTYARAASAAKRWSRQCGERTLVIADEAHHLGDDLAWGSGFALAFGATKRWLLLSGTPFRSDQSQIPGVRYEDGVVVPDVSYTYADAVRDGICRPVEFIPYDGTLQWQSGDDVIEASFSDVLSGREASRRYRTAISTELADGLPRILAAANAKLDEVRAGDHKDAGGLVIAADGQHARRVAKLLRKVTGHVPTVVLHDEARSAQKLREFRESRERWIVAVNMVSEGVDIPRLRVGVYATAAKTPLIFRQIVGRFVRTIPGRPVDRSHLYLPGDPILRVQAQEVETELRHVLRPPKEEDPFALDEVREERTQTEPTENPFQALNAEVSPQMALFGGGPPPPAPPKPTAPIAFAGPPAIPDRPEGEEVPAFEQRSRLRARRRDLVGTLADLDGRSHREINGWLNRETGVEKVDKATIKQLERSVDILIRELDRLSKRRRAS